MTGLSQPLPIDEALPALRAALGANTQAPCSSRRRARARPRASPLALLDEPWAKGKRLILLEPRRLAARAAAARMAATLGEKVGETIGLRVRLQSLVSKRTRIEVVTEGVFTRMILDDPSLEGVAAVLFDEFHERSLDADLGLALRARRAAGPARGPAASGHVGDARRRARALAPRRRAADRKQRPRLIRSRRAMSDANPSARIEDEVARVTLDALARESGSILVFLPGQSEIRRVAETLSARVRRRRRHRAALRSAGRPCAGSRHRARARRAAQDRARDLDRRDVAHHRRRARRRRQRPHARARLRARRRADAARDGARQPEPTPTSGAGERDAWSPASATGCGRRPRTADFSLTPRPRFSPPISRASCSTARSGASPIRRARLSRSPAARRAR